MSINGTVYHTSTSGQIATYDIATCTQTVLETNNNIKAGCINKHPTKRELYICRNSNKLFERKTESNCRRNYSVKIER